jgi:predicted Fe-Mo cluster-binding NifX family protein
MRLLVPTAEPPSLTARVSSHFGRAPFSAVLGTDTGEVTSLGGPSAHHECGMLAAALLQEGVQAVACAGLGPGALASLTAAGIPVYMTRERSVAQVADAWHAGSMAAAGEIDTCHDQGHGQGEGHSHHS